MAAAHRDLIKGRAAVATGLAHVDGTEASTRLAGAAARSEEEHLLNLARIAEAEGRKRLAEINHERAQLRLGGRS